MKGYVKLAVGSGKQKTPGGGMLGLEFRFGYAQTRSRQMEGSVKRTKGLVKSAIALDARSHPSSVLLMLRSRIGSMERFLRGQRWGLAASIALGAACASTPRGATDANMAKARSGSPDGATLFKQHCAGCHGERGESVSGAPRILGVGALPEYPRERNLNADPASGDPELLKLQGQTRPAGAPWRDPFRTAQDLYDYVSKNMPLPRDKAGSLSAEQYWAIIHFMLLAHGVQVPPEGVTANNARSVKL